MKKLRLLFAAILLGTFSFVRAAGEKSDMHRLQLANNSHGNPMVPIYWIVGGVVFLLAIVIIFTKKKATNSKDSKNDGGFESVESRYAKFRNNGNVSQFFY